MSPLAWLSFRQSTWSPTTIAMTGLSLTLAIGIPAFPVAAETTETAQKTLLMGTEADYIPFEFRVASDPPSGIIGFDIALAQLIAERLGLEIEIQEQTFDSLLPALQAGDLDFAIAAITPTPARLELVDFSIPYFESRQALVSRRTSPIRTLADLAGTRVAVQTGTLQAEVAQQLITEGVAIEVQSFERMNDIISAIRTQTADVALVEELVAEAYLENNPTLELDVLGELPPTPVAIAFPKGSPYLEPFNEVIQAIAASGELESLTLNWFTTSH